MHTVTLLTASVLAAQIFFRQLPTPLLAPAMADADPAKIEQLARCADDAARCSELAAWLLSRVEEPSRSLLLWLLDLLLDVAAEAFASTGPNLPYAYAHNGRRWGVQVGRPEQPRRTR